MPKINNSKLRTDFICVATSGYTVDGRQITAQELHEMAESYDPEFYTANIWPDHWRWTNLGQVLELKAEDFPNGETKLFAILAPNEELISLNKEGQNLFTSVEIMPNFRNSGKNYLCGLAVTDTPASVGTTQLQFSTKSMPKEAYASKPIPVNFTLNNQDEEQLKNSMWDIFKRFFSTKTDSQDSENNNNKEDPPMDKEQFNQLINAVNGLAEKVDKHFSAKTETPAAEPAKEPSNEGQGSETQVTAEQFNQLMNAVDKLQKQFTEMSQEKTVVPAGVPTENGEKKFTLKQGI